MKLSATLFVFCAERERVCVLNFKANILTFWCFLVSFIIDCCCGRVQNRKNKPTSAMASPARDLPHHVTASVSEDGMPLVRSRRLSRPIDLEVWRWSWCACAHTQCPFDCWVHSTVHQAKQVFECLGFLVHFPKWTWVLYFLWLTERSRGQSWGKEKATNVRTNQNAETMTSKSYNKT